VPADTIVDGFVTDVTAQRQTLEQLRRIEETVRVGAYCIVLPGWSVWWSEGTPAVRGLPPGTVASGAALEASTVPEVGSMLRASMENAARGAYHVDLDVPLKPRGEESRWVRFIVLCRPVWRHPTLL
jgi:hypothetical protein